MYDSSLKTGAFSTFIAKDLNLSYLQVSRKESDNLIFSIIWQLVNNLALMIWNSIVNRSIFERDLRIFVSLQTVENVQQRSTDKRVNQKVLTFQAWFLRWFRIPAFGQHWNLAALPPCASSGVKSPKYANCSRDQRFLNIFAPSFMRATVYSFTLRVAGP